MRKVMIVLLATVVASIMAVAFPAMAVDTMKTKTVDGLRVELHVLPAEPFFTAEEVKAKQAKEGMLIMGGAKPVPPDASPRPNHHLVVHVYGAKTVKALTNAKVIMSFRTLDANGKPAGTEVAVPVVIMQAIGKGPQSTHYGNNVVMPAGMYSVMVSADGKKARFHITVSDASSEKMKMH